jgi:hypothetical protein
MQRRYRVFPGKRRHRGLLWVPSAAGPVPALIHRRRDARFPVRRHRGLLWIPPSVPSSSSGPPPALVHRHRKARFPAHRHHGHLLWTPPVPQAPAVVFSYGEPFFDWAYGSPYLS